MDYLLSKVVDSFLPKLANYALGETETSVYGSLKNHLNLLSAHASDIEEQIKNAELLGTKKRKRAVECWLEQVQSIANEVGSLINDIQTRGFVKFFSEGRAANLDARVSELVEQRPDSSELVVDDHNKVQGDEHFIGVLVGEKFKENLERIWILLVIEKVSCIGILGMGGIGKTTLAKHVNNRLVKESSYRVVWITVSQEYSVHMLQDKIAKDLQIDISDLHDVDQRSIALNKVLSKIKNVVLIFDNVWERVDLMEMGHPLSVDGCRLIITTRKRQVCHQIGCKDVIEVTTLQENEAWVLFKEIHGPELNLTTEVKRIVKSTIQVCKGLPLGIITLAGSMRGMTTAHAWSDVLAQFEESVMGQDDMDKNVFKVLKHSFDRLGPKDGKRNGYSKSQLCFLYCSTYPEDHEIDREKLIRKFIVEEYLDRKSRKALFNEGHTILDNLVYACLLEKGPHGGVKMHDLLRAMALEITKGKVKVFDGQKSSLEDIPNEELWTQDIEKIFLWNVQRESFPNIMTPDCPKLSTIVLNLSPLRGTSSYSSLTALPDLFFLHMHCLCILDMSKSGIEILPNSLSDVVSLKALLFKGCWCLRYVPNLGKLKNLEELDLSNTAIEEAPQGMEELTNLKFLSFCEAERMKGTIMLLNFTKIQCLLLPPQMDLQYKEVVALKHLEEFHGRLKDVSSCLKLIRSKPGLKCRITVETYRNNIATGHLVFCETNLKELLVHLYKFDFEVAKDEDVALLSKANISRLLLEGCKWQSKCIIDIVSRMCNPASLKSLKVRFDKRVECLRRRQEFLASTSTSPPLAQAVFTCLHWLEISNCKKAKRLGLLPSQFPMLEVLRIKECSDVEEIMEVDEEQGINNTVFLPNLKVLSLINLPRLKSICTATMVCTSIQCIQLWNCRELKKLPLIFGQSNDSPPPNNVGINLLEYEKEWWEALELGHPTHRRLLKLFIS